MNDQACTVLLCYDGSPQSEHAIHVAGKLFPGARTYVLNVWEPVERIIARYAVLAPFMGEELGEIDTDVPRRRPPSLVAAGVEARRERRRAATPKDARLSSRRRSRRP